MVRLLTVVSFWHSEVFTTLTHVVFFGWLVGWLVSFMVIFGSFMNTISMFACEMLKALSMQH